MNVLAHAPGARRVLGDGGVRVADERGGVLAVEVAIELVRRQVRRRQRERVRRAIVDGGVAAGAHRRLRRQ